ncbi:DNA-3-methyladenine glycosylase family protein [Ureibacillus sp. FSL K6-2830]|jgi:DNA-3-methyladenine glycosylase II|uniref:DNA-3-methyladenine glycosylase family protein n=1 Tax=Ureibacillus sp. FSL K6-2830 TaxID=2954610 RepID=UPI0030F95153
MRKVFRTEPDINNELILLDPVLKKIINACGPLEVELSTDYFSFLSRSIIGQQLSNKVAFVIWNRLLSLMDGEPSPQKLISLEDEKLREIGVSYSKIGYLKNLSSAVLNNEICLDNLEGIENEEIVKNLTKVKGIGQWTAEMFLIFCLGRRDVFSLGDGGLQRSIKWLYRLDEVPKRKQLMQISEKWKPYRTFASLYLWEAINKNLINRNF